MTLFFRAFFVQIWFATSMTSCVALIPLLPHNRVMNVPMATSTFVCSTSSTSKVRRLKRSISRLHQSTNTYDHGTTDHSNSYEQQYQTWVKQQQQQQQQQQQLQQQQMQIEQQQSSMYTGEGVTHSTDNSSTENSSSTSSPPRRSRLADRLRQLDQGGASSSYLSSLQQQQQQQIDYPSAPTAIDDNDDGQGDELYLQVKQGIVQIKSKEQHAAFLRAHMDKIIVMKFKASYCRACMAIETPFLDTKNEPTLSNLPIVWAECTASVSNKVLFRQLSVLSLPTIHFYDNGQLIENFACGPAKIPLLRQKLVDVLKRRLDPTTLQLKPITLMDKTTNTLLMKESLPFHTEQTVSGPGNDGSITSIQVTDKPRRVREIRIGDELITQEHIDFLRKELPFFQSVSDEEFDELLSKTKLQTFLPGDIIIRQGLPGKTFYVIKSGTVEMCIRSRFELPISTPSSYLGAVVNQLTKFDYFGERACTTGEPYAASIRVLTKTRCFAFDATIIPESSILSKKRRATQELVDQLTERYVLPGDYKATYEMTAKDECVLDLLVRFKQVRQAAKCFEYVMNAKPLLGDKGEIARRSMLVSKLSKSQRQDFIDVFQMADVHQRGTISLLEMRRFMESARKNVHYSDAELLDIIRKAHPTDTAGTDEATIVNGGAANDLQEQSFGTTGITLNEFLGVMAEAEFYYLFTETFQELDVENTGYVRAGDLDDVLNGVRFLITDDRKSIIDVEDQDIQVDYEQFAKMLLGAAL